MEKKEFSKFEIAVIKRTAQNVNPMVTKRAKLMEKINALQEEYDKLTVMQEQYEASIKTMTGGYGTEDLVDKVIEDTSKVNKDGNPIKITKYTLKYPDTVVPPTMDNSDTGDSVDDTEKAPEVEVPAEDAVTIDPTVESPLAPDREGKEHGTDSSDLPFMN